MLRGRDAQGLADSLARHPWNTAFEWRSPAGPRQILTAAQAEQFDTLGYVLLENVLGPDELADIITETDRFEAQTDAFLRTQPGGRLMILEAGAITFSTHLVTRSPRLRTCATHPTFSGLCADLIGPNANLYWDQAVYKKPEKPRRFPWHQDNGYTYVEPQQYLTCWVALTDATIENGCPWVAPRVHRRGTLRHTYVEPLGFECFVEWPEAQAVPVHAGGVVVFSSLTPHMTGPNTSGAERKAYILQYAPTGARVQLGDPSAGPPTGEAPCDDPDRQFAVVRDGEPARGPGTSSL